MATQLDALMEKLRSVEAEIEAELTRRREALRFRFENRRIVFEQDVRRMHRAIKVRATRYFIDAHPLIVLSAPVIYSLIVPIAMEEKLRFAIREGGRTVGAGVVTKIVK